MSSTDNLSEALHMLCACTASLIRWSPIQRIRMVTYRAGNRQQNLNASQAILAASRARLPDLT